MQTTSDPVWTREDGSVIVSLGPGYHVDLSVDFGATWTAFHPGEARSLATGLRAVADALEDRDLSK